MNSSAPALRLELTPKYPSDERLTPLARSLIDELRDFEVAVSVPAEASSADGAKGDPLTIGTLVLAAAPAVLPKLLDFLKEWSSRAKGTVELLTLRAEVDGRVLELRYPPDAPPAPEIVRAYLEALRKRETE